MEGKLQPDESFEKDFFLNTLRLRQFSKRGFKLKISRQQFCCLKIIKTLHPGPSIFNSSVLNLLIQSVDPFDFEPFNLCLHNVTQLISFFLLKVFNCRSCQSKKRIHCFFLATPCEPSPKRLRSLRLLIRN